MMPVSQIVPRRKDPPRHAYVHVPFCRHRCGYCDFTLVAGRDDLIDRYFEALALELERVGGRLAFDTLYLGGGTPSHLGPDGLRRLFDHLLPWLVPSTDADGSPEVTVEANPLDVTADFVAAALACGVTRVSLGAQSLNTATLRTLDRDHEPSDVRHGVDRLLAAGMLVNVDLMIAAPGQSLADVERDLDRFVELGCGHVSVYCLTWEKGTAFDSARRRGALRPLDDVQERRLFEAAIDRLEVAGYEHYEVSNFARPGRRCRHNEAYWDCRPWEGFGPGAARFDGRTRITNHRGVVTWVDRLLSGRAPHGEIDRMSDEEAARERVVVGLRRRDGLQRRAFEQSSGFALDLIAGPAIRRWVGGGFATDDGDRVRLTREGLLISDALWADVLSGTSACDS